MDKLCQRLGEIFADDNVDVDEVAEVLEAYKSNPAEWGRFAQFDAHKYTRNLVDEGNGKYNLMLLCWGPGMGSSIHDHTDSHCFVKVLAGQLTETRFAWPKGGDGPLVETQRKTFPTNGVTYMSDDLGLHRMENGSHVDDCVSLHLYIPAFDHCHMFDERTGKKTKCQVTFFSKYGVKIDYSGRKFGQAVISNNDNNNNNSTLQIATSMAPEIVAT